MPTLYSIDLYFPKTNKLCALEAISELVQKTGGGKKRPGTNEIFLFSVDDFIKTWLQSNSNIVEIDGVVKAQVGYLNVFPSNRTLNK